MAFETLALRRFRARYNSTNEDNPLRLKFIVDGAKEAPASAAITIYAPGSSVALVTAAAMTVVGTTALEYAVDTTTVASWPVATGYRADIEITDGSAVVHSRVVMFDVTRFLLKIPLDTDQLSQLDEMAGVMTHGSGDDLSPIIEACRDDLQLLIEAKANEDGEIVEDMILSSESLASVFRYKVLAAAFNEKRDYEHADRYLKEFDRLLVAMLSNARYDRDGDGDEDNASDKPLHITRFVT